MKIISWNVNGIRACYKKGLEEFVRRENPDIFCVQETKALLEQVGPEISELADRKSYWFSAEKRGYSGVATFVLDEPVEVIKGIGNKKFDIEGRVIVTGHKDFLLYNIYFPNGGMGETRQSYKMEFLFKLNSHLKSQIKKGREIIVLGDFNVAPNEIDVHDPVGLANTTGFLPEEREWFEEFIKLGFIDTFRKYFPNEPHRFSWWDYRTRARVGNRGWRIDHICVTKGLESRLIDADILDHVEGSDHCPVLLELK